MTERRDWRWEDYALFAGVQEMEDALMSALAAGMMEVTYKLPTLTWLAIIDEIKDRRPRNFSQLLRDDMVARLEEAIERLHEETTFLIANGPGSVAARSGDNRPTTKRDVISAELKRQLRQGGLE